MFNKFFVIRAFPRTGSTLVRHNLSGYFNTNVDHTHELTYTPPHTDITVIVTRRRNVFDCLCSHFVMLHTGEMSLYTGKQFDQFDINKQDFLNLFRAHQNWYKQIDISGYRNVIEIWFEDLMSDPYYLFGKFNIVEKTSYQLTQQSPNRYKDLINNVDDLRNYYELLLQKENT